MVNMIVLFLAVVERIVSMFTFVKIQIWNDPLTVTWPPMYTDYGYKNYQNWLNIGGFDNITIDLQAR